MAHPESTTSRFWNSDNDGLGEAINTTANANADDDGDDANDDTNDYSSYWQSIPDPPTLAAAAASDSASNSVTVASEEEEVPKKPPTTTTTTTATATLGGEGGMRRIRNRKVRCGDSTTFAFRDVTNRRRQSSNDNIVNSLKKKKTAAAAAAAAVESFQLSEYSELAAPKSPRPDMEKGRRDDRQLETGSEKRKKRRTSTTSTSVSLPNDNDEESLSKTSLRFNSQYAASSADASRSSERANRSSKNPRGVEAENVDSGENAKRRTPESEIRAGTTAATEASGDPAGAAEEERLVRSVRDYCSLPLDRRVRSAESEEIESLSSYPMPDRIAHPSRGEREAEFLRRVRPVVREMERGKRRDAATARRATGCEARRDGGGGYRYYEVDGGGMVRSEEYGRRYVAMLDERRRKRRAGDSEDYSTGDSNAECEERLRGRSEGRDPIRNCRVEESYGRDSAEDHSNDVAIDDEGEEHHDSPEERGSDDSNMDMDESVCMDDSPMNMLMPSPAAPSDETVGATAANCLLGGCSKDSPDTIGSSHGDIVNIPDEQHCGSNHDSQEHSLLAGMPPTNDPRVVVARRTLWRAIDAALANYSREILATEESTDNDAVDTRQKDPNI